MATLRIHVPVHARRSRIVRNVRPPALAAVERLPLLANPTWCRAIAAVRDDRHLRHIIPADWFERAGAREMRASFVTRARFTPAIALGFVTVFERMADGESAEDIGDVWRTLYALAIEPNARHDAAVLWACVASTARLINRARVRPDRGSYARDPIEFRGWLYRAARESGNLQRWQRDLTWRREDHAAALGSLRALDPARLP